MDGKGRILIAASYVEKLCQSVITPTSSFSTANGYRLSDGAFHLAAPSDVDPAEPFLSGSPGEGVGLNRPQRISFISDLLMSRVRP